jgi:hypothetical protein
MVTIDEKTLNELLFRLEMFRKVKALCERLDGRKLVSL